MTTKTTIAAFALLLLAGCGGEEPSAPQTPDRAAMEKADAEARRALVDRRAEIVEELSGDDVAPERRAELGAEVKRLSEEIKKANNDRLRRDREEVRRIISEQKKRGAK